MVYNASNETPSESQLHTYLGPANFSSHLAMSFLGPKQVDRIYQLNNKECDMKKFLSPNVTCTHQSCNNNHKVVASSHNGSYLTCTHGSLVHAPHILSID